MFNRALTAIRRNLVAWLGGKFARVDVHGSFVNSPPGAPCDVWGMVTPAS